MNDSSLLPEIARRLPPATRAVRGGVADDLFSVFWARAASAGSSIKRYHLLYQGGSRLARTFDGQAVLDLFDGQLRLAIAEKASGWIFLHAGVVGWRGGAVVIPGRSHSGKSRLVEALVRRGATYYSDEYAVLDAEGRVHPYAAPLSLRDEAGGRRTVVPEAGASAGPRPALPVRRVVLTRYRPRATWRPRALSPGRAVLGLLDHAVPARRRPADVLEVLQRIASDAVVYHGARGEADAVASRLLAD